eukprot:SAG11_NODE_7951_length_1078_cov_1.409602_1_plen_67_part_10
MIVPRSIAILNFSTVRVYDSTTVRSLERRLNEKSGSQVDLALGAALLVQQSAIRETGEAQLMCSQGP